MNFRHGTHGRVRITNPLVIRAFAWFWKARLGKDRVVVVKGWRQATVDSEGGQRQSIAFCGWFGD